jgi:hypothetical protein
LRTFGTFEAVHGELGKAYARFSAGKITDK